MTAVDPITTCFLASPAAPKTAMSALEPDGYLTGVIVTPQAVPARPSAWIGRLWGDDDPIFADEAQINAALGAVALRYNTLIRDIDRSLERLEVERTVDYRPLFVAGDQKPSHDAVRAWARGFWRAMALAPATWSKLVEDERTKIIIEPFVGFFDVGGLDSNEVPDDIDNLLDAEAALIPRMILVLRKLARIREAAGPPAPLPRHVKIGRNDPCPCGLGKEIQALLRSRLTARCGRTLLRTSRIWAASDSLAFAGERRIDGRAGGLL